MTDLGKKELLEEIKSKLKTNATAYMFIGLALALFLFVVVIIGIYSKGIQHLQHRHIGALVFLAFCCCLSVWYALNNYRFIRKIDSLDTPDQLLSGYEKKGKKEHMLSFLVQLGIFFFCIDSIFFFDPFPELFWNIIMALVLIAVLAFLIYFYKKSGPKVPLRDKKLIEKLRELSEKK